MARRGPRPVPTPLKAVRGVRPYRINRAEPIPPVQRPRCPRWVSPEARKVWRRLAPGLIAKHVLTIWDESMFAVLCEAIARHRRIAKGLAETELLIQGKRGMVKNPLIAALREAEATIRAFSIEFGLTPSSRSTIKTEVPRSASPVMQPVRDRTPATEGDA